jgi:IS30 family transposase
VLRKRCGRRQKLVKNGWLHDFVRGKLIHRRWSPEQIACRLKSMHPDDPTRLISHETIYAAIYAQPKGGLKTEMIAALRQHKPIRGLRRTTLAGGSIAPKSLRIIHRPEEIEPVWCPVTGKAI